MAERLFRVELTASFLERLAAIEAFLTEADAAFAFDNLLADPALAGCGRCARTLILDDHAKRTDMTSEAFARVKIDALLAAQGWDTLDTNAVRFEVMLPDGIRADYVLCDRHGRSVAVIEAKRYSVSPGDAAAQAKSYAQQLGVPYAFLCNGNEVLFRDWQREAYPRPVKAIFKQDAWNAGLPRWRSAATLSACRSISASSSATIRWNASTPCAERLASGGASCSSRWPPAPARHARRRHSSSACSRPTRSPASYS